MYRYYQLSDFDTWKAGQDDEPNNPWKFAKTHNASRVTIFCVSNDVDLIKEHSEPLKYSGPLFFDIDDKDLSVALASAVVLATKLKELGVQENDIEIHLSGKKGVHIYVDQRIFCKEDQVEFLPEIYAKMAMHLWVEGMDFQVYSEGKGRMVRPPNSQRPDKAYKVQVLFSELCTVTAENYKDWVAAARQDPLPKGDVKWAVNLSKSFQGCKSSLRARGEKDRSIPASAIARIGAVVPDCVLMLSEGKRRKVAGDANTSFNSMGMQLGCWSKSSLVEPTVLESVQRRVASNNPSTSGDTENNRFQKIRSMHLYLKTQDKYKFSCAGIKRVIEGTPSCSTCPIYVEDQASSSVIEGMFLYEKMGSYYSDKDCERLVATFTMSRDRIIINEETDRAESSIISLNVPLTGRVEKVQDFDEMAFTSKMALKKQLAGYEGVSFLGNDNDVARLRNLLTKNDLLGGAEVNMTAKALTVGIMYRRRKGPEDARHPEHKGRFTYVEPGFSLNDAGVQNSHQLARTVVGAPKMRLKDFNLPLSTKANEAFELLTQINDPYIVSAFIGWFLTTHIKTHIMQLEHRFPLLCVSGVAGTGKNATTNVCMRLCGLEGESAMMTLEAPNITMFPLHQGLTSSTTIPKVINEFNPKSMHVRKYGDIIETIKAAFDGRSVQKGILGGGDKSGVNASVVELIITAPVITLSEEPINIPAVLHRGIMLDMTPRGMKTGIQWFTKLEPRADDLADIGRVLIKAALNTPIQEVARLMKIHELPSKVRESNLNERLKHGYHMVIVGYAWAEAALDNAGLSHSNIKRLKLLSKYFAQHITDNIKENMLHTSMTEVDKVVKDIAVMASSTTNNNLIGNTAITKGIHYAVQGGLLYLDIMCIYPCLIAFKRGQLSVKTDDAFMRVVKAMDYYVSDVAVTNLLPTGGRVVLSLNMELMADKGLPVEMFL